MKVFHARHKLIHQVAFCGKIWTVTWECLPDLPGDNLKAQGLGTLYSHHPHTPPLPCSRPTRRTGTPADSNQSLNRLENRFAQRISIQPIRPSLDLSLLISVEVVQICMHVLRSWW